MTKSRNIPIRFSEEMIADMEKVAEGMGLANRSDLIKLCVKSFLHYFRQKGKASLPVNWEEILKEMDGRSHRYLDAAGKKRNGEA